MSDYEGLPRVRPAVLKLEWITNDKMRLVITEGELTVIGADRPYSLQENDTFTFMTTFERGL